ncbi:hypothetical protein AGR4A_pAt10006 [Agrobacterium tumefaciens str. B6]|uniref:Uncharacterized protein n=1 Tax=Agrobacterium tumefaciens str. B6 TaxID=1183423 RepID=A0A822VB96_AGRTU|nr:hypothetical protein AGR4A_pAt10006 [Agrobacterium tumefaciens str. B6]
MQGGETAEGATAAIGAFQSRDSSLYDQDTQLPDLEVLLDKRGAMNLRRMVRTHGNRKARLVEP